MLKRSLYLQAGLQALCLAAVALTSASLSAASAVPPVLVQLRRGLVLAARGRCAQALPALRAGWPAAARQPRSIYRRAGLDAIRCAMLLNQPRRALYFLPALQAGFPRDAEVNFLAVHIYSQLASAASARLLRVAPGSYQVHELHAEALESMGHWTQAAAEYRQVLKLHPGLPGIHYRIGRLLLSVPHPSPASLAAARQEFHAELKVDPANAGALYILGVMHFQARQFLPAIADFRRACRINPEFADAQLGLGRALVAAHQYTAALAPLRQAVRLDGANPTPHYYLALADLHTGHAAAARRQMQLQRQALARIHAAQDRVRRALQGLPPANSAAH